MKHLQKIFLGISMGLMLNACMPMNSNINKQIVIKDQSKEKLSFPAARKDFFSHKIQKQSSYFTIKPDKDTTIYGPEGSSIFFPANCLVDENGLPAKGFVLVELKEVYDKKSIIETNVPTLSNGLMLETDGSLYINASNQTGNLFISCNEGIKVGLPKPNRYDMSLFYGNRNKNGDINWILQENLNNENQEREDAEPEYIGENNNMWTTWNDSYYSENQEVSNYLFTVKKLGWINCDRFYEDEREKTTICLTIENKNILNYKTGVYLIFENINSVMQAYSDDGIHYQTNNIPIGEELSIIIISGTEKSLLFKEQKAKSQLNSNVSVLLETVDEKTLKSRLADI